MKSLIFSIILLFSAVAGAQACTPLVPGQWQYLSDPFATEPPFGWCNSLSVLNYASVSYYDTPCGGLVEGQIQYFPGINRFLTCFNSNRYRVGDVIGTPMGDCTGQPGKILYSGGDVLMCHGTTWFKM